MKQKALALGLPAVLALAAAWLFFAPPPRVGYAPEQPFDYSHKLHAGEYQIDCQYCHTGATVGKKAGVPSMNVCMNCHLSVGYGKEGVTQLQKMWKEKKSPEWVRVHNLPDHVRFAHGPHVNALLKDGMKTKEACAECHGNIADMQVVEQVEPMNMGWCVNCHRDFRDEKKYVDHGVDVSCNTCHY